LLIWCRNPSCLCAHSAAPLPGEELKRSAHISRNKGVMLRHSKHVRWVSPTNALTIMHGVRAFALILRVPQHDPFFIFRCLCPRQQLYYLHISHILTASTASLTSCTRKIFAPLARAMAFRAVVPFKASAAVMPNVL
jgi:hypothetical protein